MSPHASWHPALTLNLSIVRVRGGPWSFHFSVLAFIVNGYNHFRSNEYAIRADSLSTQLGICVEGILCHHESLPREPQLCPRPPRTQLLETHFLELIWGPKRSCHVSIGLQPCSWERRSAKDIHVNNVVPQQRPQQEHGKDKKESGPQKPSHGILPSLARIPSRLHLESEKLLMLLHYHFLQLVKYRTLVLLQHCSLDFHSVQLIFVAAACSLQLDRFFGL
mmetsp:Transcript_22938/g.50028  ORF Transcript_22938/g.50028 Transcript_22938/m.50028 type:complete len:221 (+) Transcript_22938:108-770(+)